MTEILNITRMGQRGDGVAETPDGLVFVAYALPGETVEVEAIPGHPDRRQLVRVVTPSSARIAPFCPHFGVCGGCAIQHWADEPYRKWKRDLVVTALAQAGIETQVDDLIDAHGEGRRRATFHARRGPDGEPLVGFSEARSHRIIALDTCPVLAPSMKGALAAARDIAKALLGRGKPLDIQVTATDNGLDVDVRGSGAIGAAETATLARHAETHRLARITRHGELVMQRAAPVVQVGKAPLVLPPGSFLQATQVGEETLARLVVTHVAKAKTVVDLFCGVGPFALRLAEKARVTAIDGDVAAIESLQQAAAATPGLRAIAVQRRDLFRRPLTAAELKTFDAVLFDPPRQGAQAQARELAASRVPVAVAVSCNAGTFARDARTLIDGGYRFAQVTPVDQFRHSAHVEIVAKFVR